jgi:hypothetical protein
MVTVFRPVVGERFQRVPARRSTQPAYFSDGLLAGNMKGSCPIVE